MNQELRDLYQASKELNQLKGWEFYESGSPILIKPSQTDETAYCILIDEGINVYFGDRGIGSYLDWTFSLLTNEEENEAFKNFYRQEMVRISYVDRQEVSEEDYTQIQSTGIGFRGKNQWPIFRRFEAGVIPHAVNDSKEISYLAFVLRQLLVILSEIKKGKLSFEKDKLITSTYQQNQWITEIEETELAIHDVTYKFKYKNDLKIHRLKKLPQVDVQLEAIQFFLPEPYLDEVSNQGVFPLITAFIEQGMGTVTLNHFSKHHPEELMEVTDKLAEVMLNELKYRPSEIVVGDDFLLEMIEDFCHKAGIECYTDAVPQATEFMESILAMRGFDKEINEEDDFDFDGFDEEEPFSQEELNQLLQIGNALDEWMRENTSYKKLPEIEREATLEVFINAFMYMGQNEWSIKDFEHYLESRRLEEEIEPIYRKYISSAMLRFLECAGQLSLLKNSAELIKVAKHHYGD